MLARRSIRDRISSIVKLFVMVSGTVGYWGKEVRRGNVLNHLDGISSRKKPREAKRDEAGKHTDDPRTNPRIKSLYVQLLLGGRDEKKRKEGEEEGKVGEKKRERKWGRFFPVAPLGFVRFNFRQQEDLTTIQQYYYSITGPLLATTQDSRNGTGFQSSIPGIHS